MNLETTYLGIKLSNPLIAGASPLTSTVDGVRHLEDAGAAAVVLPSIFEEQLTHEALELHYNTTITADSFAEALSYFPEPEKFVVGPDEYLKLISAAKEAVNIPVIASMNGVTNGGWINTAAKLVEAGADAIELNIYYLATDPNTSSADVEKHYVEVVKQVKTVAKVPVAVKMTPFFSSPSAMAKLLAGNGADGLVLFNRFYQPDFDLEKMEVNPSLHLSNSDDIRIALRWIAILHGRVNASLCATGGCHTPQDAIKYLLAGADAVQLASVLLKHGPAYVSKLKSGIEAWLHDREYVSVQQLKGAMSQKNVADPSAFERANYMKTLQSYHWKHTA